MTETGKDECDIDALLQAAQRAGPMPSDALMARVLALAETEQPPAMPVTGTAAVLPRRRVLRDLFGQIGGWRLAGGLSSVMVLGFLIGFSGAIGLQVQPASAGVDMMPVGEELFADATSGE